MIFTVESASRVLKTVHWTVFAFIPIRHVLFDSFILKPQNNKLTASAVSLLFWWFEVESNHRHEDFQSSALPTELSNHIMFK